MRNDAKITNVLHLGHEGTTSLCISLKGSPISVAAQNMHFAENGAYTGELSASMLKSVSVSHIIIGHSERRQYFHESNEMLAKKTTPQPVEILSKEKHLNIQ